METVTSTKDKIRRNLKKDIEFNAEFIRSMNSIHSQYDGNNSYDSSDSLNTISDEIPVWLNGEQRWISGVNDDTTCADLVNVLLNDEGIQQIQNNITPKKLLLNPNKNTSTTTTITDNIIANTSNLTTATNTTSNCTENRGYVITERWRRVEQILNDDTKILQIWSAWGDAKSEVKLTLRQIDPNLSIDWMGAESYTNNDKDSGMGSPNGSSNSAIIRRRKHRASKSTNAWITQAQTVHPKSQKSTIEKLMKLILEQGETIQQQLAKLRDRELQITKIEEERHKNREKEHGKNYLLETYLNGLPEVEVKEIVTVHSDSGVQTEGATSSPEISCSVSYNQNEDDTDYIIKSILTTQPATVSLSHESQKLKGFTNNSNYKEKPSHREKKLLKDHKQAKEFSSLLQQNENYNNNNNNNIGVVEGGKTSLSSSSSATTSTGKLSPSITIYSSSIQNNNCNPRKIGKYPLLSSKTEEMVMMMEQQYSDDIITTEQDIPEKIEWMEKLVAINKHLQREEELLVRLGAKIRKYETEKTTHLNENEIRNAIIKINTNIDVSNMEINKIETDLHYSQEQLEQKANILEKLNNELLNSNNNNNNISTIVNTENSNDINHQNLQLPEIQIENSNLTEIKMTDDDNILETLDTISKLDIELAEGNIINLKRDNLVENLYNFSQYILKPSNYDYNTKNENFNRDEKQLTTISPAINIVTSTLPAIGNELDRQQNPREQMQNKIYNGNNNLSLLNTYPPPPQGFECNLPDILTIQQQNVTKTAPILNCKNLKPILRASTPIQHSTESYPNTNSFVNSIPPGSVNFLQKSNRNCNKQIFNNNVNDQQQLLLHQQQQQQHQTNMNIYSTINRIPKKLPIIVSDVNGSTGSTSTPSKFGPKRLINGICNEFESNSDTGLSSMGEDVLHLGTLV